MNLDLVGGVEVFEGFGDMGGYGFFIFVDLDMGLVRDVSNCRK